MLMCAAADVDGPLPSASTPKAPVSTARRETWRSHRRKSARMGTKIRSFADVIFRSVVRPHLHTAFPLLNLPRETY